MAKRESEALLQAFWQFQKQHDVEEVIAIYSNYLPEMADDVGRDLRYILRSLQPLVSSGLLNQLSSRMMDQMQIALESAIRIWPEVKSSSAVESLTHYSFILKELVRSLQSSGMHVEMSDIESLSARAREALMFAEVAREEAERNRREAAEVRKNIETLGVTFSLSTSFESRRKSLYRGRLLWLCVALILATISIVKTFDFAYSVASLIDDAMAGKAVRTSGVVWAYLGIRSVILFPLFAAFVFAFSQYKKERDLEEEYAHKAAVANSLPNYGQMASDPAVRDQIITGATNVIFSSPISMSTSAQQNNGSMEGAAKLFESISKIMERGRS